MVAVLFRVKFIYVVNIDPYAMKILWYAIHVMLDLW